MVSLFARAPELFDGTPLLAESLLGANECTIYVDQVLNLADHWQRRSESDFFTLGAASYLDGAWDAEPYHSSAQRCNPVLADHFSDLYRKLSITLARLIGPVAYEPELAMPGFHVFCPKPGETMHLNTKVLASAGGMIHFDLQQHDHSTFWSRYSKVDWHHPLSFTLALELPAAGAGLRFWPKCRDAGRATPSLAEEVSYRVGDLTLFLLPLLHQIAPVAFLTASDRRITLQGHGLRCDGIWRLYF